MFNLSEIHFSELINYNDNNSIIMTGTEITESDISAVVEFFEESGLCPEGKHVIGLKRILDNVRGNEGRTDWLVLLDGDNTICNPMVRLQYGGWIKWTSDFIENFRSDYFDVAA